MEHDFAVELPDDVLRHLERMHEEELEGWWRLRDYMETRGCGEKKARKELRNFARKGMLDRKQVNLGAAQAWAMGLLGPGHTIMYRFRSVS